MKIKIQKLKSAAVLPSYQSIGAAGADVHACLPGMGESLAPGEIKTFNTGIAVEIPDGYEIQIRSRSGLASQGIVVFNSPGTVDSDYRGEIRVILMNLGKQGRRFAHGERIAQLVLSKVEQIQWSFAEELKPTKRGKGALGSTGR